VAYPAEIAALQTVSTSQTLEEAGHVARHNELKTALESIRTALGDTVPLISTLAPLASPTFTGSPLLTGSSEGNQQVPAEQFFYLGANGSTIANSPTNPYGVAPNLAAYGVYDFEYYLMLLNSSTGAITAGWASTAKTKFFATIDIYPLTNGTAFVGLNPFIDSTANKAITGGATNATYILHIRGSITAQNAVARLPLNVQVASGNLTPVGGSWFRFIKRGVSSSGTGNITIGNVA
jgi:hypothetical protein